MRLLPLEAFYIIQAIIAFIIPEQPSCKIIVVGFAIMYRFSLGE